MVVEAEVHLGLALLVEVLAERHVELALVHVREQEVLLAAVVSDSLDQLVELGPFEHALGALAVDELSLLVRLLRVGHHPLVAPLLHQVLHQLEQLRVPQEAAQLRVEVVHERLVRPPLRRAARL